jgi:hypothetical protein
LSRICAPIADRCCRATIRVAAHPRLHRRSLLSRIRAPVADR